MATVQEALDAIAKINDATNQQGTVLAAEATSLQTISTNIAALVAQAGTTVPQNVLDGLNAAAASAQAISTTIGQQAAFSQALAAQGVTNPVPAPVPAPAPAPISV